MDVVFTCDAFYEFPDKRGTLRKLHRVLREGGAFAIVAETAGKARSFVKLVKGTGLFSVVERDGKFCKFRKKVGEVEHGTV